MDKTKQITVMINRKLVKMLISEYMKLIKMI